MTKAATKSEKKRRRRARKAEEHALVRDPKRAEEPERITLPQWPWDAGAKGPANRKRLREEAATEIDPRTGKPQPNPNGVRRMRRETWVQTYMRKGKLTKDQAAKAENLYAAWAGHPVRDPLAALGDRVDGGGCDDMNAVLMDAKRWFFKMRDQIQKRSWPVIEHVVLDDRPLRAMAGCYNSATESKYLDRLKDGLDAIS